MKFYKADPGIYINRKTGKGIVINDDAEIKTGRIKLVKEKYLYFQYREGKKIKNVYVGISRCKKEKKCRQYKTKGEF